jgi:PAS domain S-box-containing protein
MKAPLPMTITQAKGGTFMEINKATEKYMGLSRRTLIGRKSSESGHMTVAQRLMIINAIKEKGYAKNIELESRIKKNEVLFYYLMCFR